MSVIATEGIFSYGMQSAKGTLATSFFRHKAMDIDYGAIDRQAVVPQEVGGIAVPTGAYKSGAFLAGGATLNPRMEGDFGWLFKGLLGTAASKDAGTVDGNALPSHALDGTSVSAGLGAPPAARKTILRVTCATANGVSVKNVVITGTGGGPDTVDIGTGYVAGETKYFYATTAFSAYTSFQLPSITGGTIAAMWVGEATTKDHFFTLSDAASLPWISVRKYVPGSTPTNDHGTIGLDNRVTGLTLTLPNTGIISARVDFLGREPTFVIDPTWTYADVMEDTDTIPLTCKTTGYVKMPGFSATKLPVAGAQITFANQVTTPDQEQIIGSPYPDDITRVLSSMTFRLALKWNDSDLYEKILTGSTTGTAWGAAIFYSDLDILVDSPELIVPGTGVLFHKLRIIAQRCALQMEGSPRLAGGGMVMMSVIGQVVEQNWGDYCQFIMTNGQANYT